MEQGDIPADVLGDLRSDDNKLSVWMVEMDRSNLDSVLVAVASSRVRLDKLDYALFEEQVLPKLAIKCVTSEGSTPHLLANGAMHRDLTELTAQKVVSLAQAMMPLESLRVPEKRIKLMLMAAIQNSVLDRARIAPQLLAQLEPLA